MVGMIIAAVSAGFLAPTRVHSTPHVIMSSAHDPGEPTDATATSFTEVMQIPGLQIDVVKAANDIALPRPQVPADADLARFYQRMLMWETPEASTMRAEHLQWLSKRVGAAVTRQQQVEQQARRYEELKVQEEARRARFQARVAAKAEAKAAARLQEELRWAALTPEEREAEERAIAEEKAAEVAKVQAQMELAGNFVGGTFQLLVGSYKTLSDTVQDETKRRAEHRERLAEERADAERKVTEAKALEERIQAAKAEEEAEKQRVEEEVSVYLLARVGRLVRNRAHSLPQ